MSTKIRMRVVSILEELGYTKLDDGTTPNNKTITLEVISTTDKSSPNYLYSFWSSGTKFPLKTINVEASAMFEIGKEFNIVISPVE